MGRGGGGTGAILLAVGSYTWFVDFEIMMSNPQASNWSAAGVSNYSAVGNKYINLVVHDNAGAGFGNFTENGPRNAEFYGNLIYNNGSIQYAGSIHGMYLTNQLSLGTVRVFAGPRMDQCVMSFPGLAPCQCFVFAGMSAMTPGARSCCSVSVAMIPSPSVTSRI